MNLTNAVLYLFISIIIITIIDTLGAIASRKLNFNYAYLSILSFTVYMILGYLLSKQYNLPIIFFIAGLLGLYDGTIGFRLSIYLKANNRLETKKSKELLTVKTAVTMIIIACVFAYFGYLLIKL
ncbi:MAG TPA: hypothetical protein VLR49_14565 [Ferruginibacter sp.]|nr:hypothetical protein [Ferruginibacter sp.]